MNNGDKKKSQILHDFHLTEDDLTDATKHKFPFYTEIFNSLNFCSHNILINKNLTLAGRHILCSKLIRKHENVKSVLNYLTLSSTQKITEFPMIFICGMIRTGTTLSHNLMACDPACCAPRTTDVTIHPIPPILRFNIAEHKRRMDNEINFQEQMFEIVRCDMKQYTENRSSSHADFECKEDVVPQEEVGVQSLFSILPRKHTNLVMWFADNKNKDFACEYHRTVLQMSHDVDPPQTHWQLKSLMHSLWIETLLKYYPQASLIMSHRHLDEVLPSVYRFSISYNSIYFNENDSHSLKIMIGQPPPGNIYDIQYEDLMKDPVDTVHRIYDHFHFLQW